MKKILFAVLSLSLLTACGDEYKYQLNENNCDTGEHTFDEKDAYCKALLDSAKNKGCAYNLRKSTYEKECGKWPEETKVASDLKVPTAQLRTDQLQSPTAEELASRIAGNPFVHSKFDFYEVKKCNEFDKDYLNSLVSNEVTPGHQILLSLINLSLQRPYEFSLACESTSSELNEDEEPLNSDLVLKKGECIVFHKSKNWAFYTYNYYSKRVYFCAP